MNGFLCGTMTAALGREGTVRGPRVRTSLRVRVKVRTLRNYLGMCGYVPKKESESHSKEPCSPRPLKKYHDPIKRPGLTATLHGTNGSLVRRLNSDRGV